jgi:hypothetical protein
MERASAAGLDAVRLAGEGIRTLDTKLGKLVFYP